ncbi:hypothetical protein [Sinimarinibacterium sp. NLF-5-8]|uniref:hypothetical protein n=1 Tax=Sinimarinibacterium sp. NLF-5-8 TaxID=2698684 RepID=UPI00137C2711|nr:hypothetical protein [Sinimarinibacterium sp. NLF-5-8]QHS09089.1 hypothetical protein GT972_02275 [Sinimarinibacterium sp. NLF-5-8]
MSTVEREIASSVHLHGAHNLRNRWIAALYHHAQATGAELAKARMCDISQSFDRRLALYLGEGKRRRRVIMSAGLVDLMFEYRFHLGLPAFPAYGETHPLIQHSLRNPMPMSPKEIQSIIDRLRKTSGQDLEG